MTASNSVLASALKQKRPFSSPESAAYLAVMRVASRFEQEVSDMLRPHGITPTQYNVLRILRGAEPDGLACGAVLDRLVTRDPDITRLLDRLEKLGLATRNRDDADRRVVRSQITAQGLELLALLDGPVNALHESQLGALDAEEVKELSEIMGKILGRYA